jgi:hypothetical protein
VSRLWKILLIFSGEPAGTRTQDHLIKSLGVLQYSQYHKVQTAPVGPFESIKELNAQQTSQDVGEQRKGMGTAFAGA